MQIPAIRNGNSKRREELRSILSVGRTRRKGRLHGLQRYVAAHFKMLLTVLVLVACVITHVYYFNILTTMRQQVSNLHAQLESGLQMRRNIVPSLTVAVNRFINYEKHVFLSAVESREKSLTMSEDLEKLVQSLKHFSGKSLSAGDLSRLMAVAENYPQLVSIQSYKLLLDQIADVENQIYSKRIEYSEAVNRYNTTLTRFPANAIGRIMGFRTQPYPTWDRKAEWAFVAETERGDSALRVEPEDGGPNK